MDEERDGKLARIEEKLDLLKRVEAEHGFGVIIEEPRKLEPIPELPEGVTEVFSLFHRLGGDYFRFEQPPEITDRRSWADRPVNPHCPLGNPLSIGCERHGVPEDIDAGNTDICLDLRDGDVYSYLPDDYVFAYKNGEEFIEVTELAPDIVTFFDVCVLGAGYPRLVESVIGGHALTLRRRRGRRARPGRHRDSWMSLLEASGLIPPMDPH
ncbi:hypothetical protein [Thermomonospora catenispora]|uniref:hypothetical protein n=1 Tax=Thermomonospora catenispora TaxID=2493090 RepID=UPI001120FF79|nr:hypothetical protein [Thermomonospora catenispora]TNY34938.1 hypothetical protein EIO00_21385 [Thermomonospora catenispora]